MKLNLIFTGILCILLLSNTASAEVINGSTYTDHLTEDFDIIGFMISPFTELMGDLFYLILLAMLVLSVFMKSQGIGLPILVCALFIFMFGNNIPVTFGTMITALIGLGFGIILLRVFKGQGG